MTTTDISNTITASPAEGRLLRAGLAFNTAICSSSGLVSLILARPLGEWMGVDPLIMALIGVALLGYAPMLLWWRSRDPLLPIHGRIPAVLDEVWVLGVIAIAIGGFGLTSGGRWLIVTTAIPVGLSAIIQWRGANRLV